MDSRCTYPCYRKNINTSSRGIEKACKIKIVFFDMDGVLIDTISSWRCIHEHFKTTNERSIDAYIRGDIDDLEFIRRDVSLWKEDGKPARKETIRQILFNLPVIEGTNKCVSFLKKHNVTTAIVSAGLDILADKVASDLGIDYVFANGVKTDKDGRLTGEGILQVQLKHKEKNVQTLAQQLHVPLELCAAVGNSCFDIPMFETCGLGIAFNPVDACVQQSADIVVKGKNLNRIIPRLKLYLPESTDRN